MSKDESAMRAARTVGLDTHHRAQLSSLYSIFVLSTLMFDGRRPEAILELAANAVPALAPCHVDALYRMVEGSLCDAHDLGRSLDTPLDTVVISNVGVDRELVLPDELWRYGLTLRTASGIAGVLVVRSPERVSPDELFLLKLLAQQAAAAVHVSDLFASERERRRQLHQLTIEHQHTIDRLRQSVSELERRQEIHETLTAVSSSGAGETGIAEALHRLTSLTVVVEDPFGNIRAWSGDTPVPPASQPIGAQNRAEVLRRAAVTNGTEREGDWLFRVIRPRGDILGVVAMRDPHRAADPVDILALESAATILALELAHQRALAESELRLRRDLVEDLLAGTDNEGALARAEALGHDLRAAHTVAILQWEAGITVDRVARAATQWATQVGLHPLTARRPAFAVLLTDGIPDASLFAAVCADVGSDRGSIGIGSAADLPCDLPRSFTHAQRALQFLQASLTPYGQRPFDDLGVYRIFDPSADQPEIRGFVIEWLGELLDYDRQKHADLVKTLAHYLDSGGNYEQTASSLSIHRSTLRYRLSRIREISGHDLHNVETRLNLHLASRLVELAGTAPTKAN